MHYWGGGGERLEGGRQHAEGSTVLGHFPFGIGLGVSCSCRTLVKVLVAILCSFHACALFKNALLVGLILKDVFTLFYIYI